MNEKSSPIAIGVVTQAEVRSQNRGNQDEQSRCSPGNFPSRGHGLDDERLDQKCNGTASLAISLQEQVIEESADPKDRS